jgi:hypothetical protein
MVRDGPSATVRDRPLRRPAEPDNRLSRTVCAPSRTVRTPRLRRGPHPRPTRRGCCRGRRRRSHPCGHRGRRHRGGRPVACAPRGPAQATCRQVRVPSVRNRRRRRAQFLQHHCTERISASSAHQRTPHRMPTSIHDTPQSDHCHRRQEKAYSDGCRCNCHAVRSSRERYHPGFPR